MSNSHELPALHDMQARDGSSMCCFIDVLFEKRQMKHIKVIVSPSGPTVVQ